jgi:hypothetical protein
MEHLMAQDANAAGFKEGLQLEVVGVNLLPVDGRILGMQLPVVRPQDRIEPCRSPLDDKAGNVKWASEM